MKICAKIIIFCIIILFMLSFQSDIGQANDEYYVCSSDKPQKDISILIHERTDILQKALYRHITVDEAKKKLCALESEDLYIDDCKHIYGWSDTELDCVKDLSITKLQQIKKYKDYASYKVSITWKMAGPEGDYMCNEDYFASIKFLPGDQIKLCKFDIL